MYICANCKVKGCSTGNNDKLPKVCPTKNRDLQEKSRELYLTDEENKKIAYYSALVEAEGYGVKTRLEEIIDFAKKCNYKKLGLAFCIGFSREAEILVKILKANDLEVVSIACKNGGLLKSEIGIKPEQTIKGIKDEVMCNPIGQALFLNEQKTDLNIILGLCVGHDSLVIKHSEAPVTVFAVKDRVLGHNPIAAIYLSDSYYRKKLYPKDDK